MKKLTRKYLLSLPERDWGKTSKYDHVVVIPSGKKHDSGYALMCLIGEWRDGSSEMQREIAGYCDDIVWDVQSVGEYGLRTEMHYKTNIIRFWSNRAVFEVGRSRSSIDIKLITQQD